MSLTLMLTFQDKICMHKICKGRAPDYCYFCSALQQSRISIKSDLVAFPKICFTFFSVQQPMMITIVKTRLFPSLLQMAQALMNVVNEVLKGTFIVP